MFLMVSKQTELYSWSYDCHVLSIIYSLFSTCIGSFMICEFGIIRKLNNKMFGVRRMKSTKNTCNIFCCLVCLSNDNLFFPLSLLYFSLKYTKACKEVISSELRFFPYINVSLVLHTMEKTLKISYLRDLQ